MKAISFRILNANNVILRAGTLEDSMQLVRMPGDYKVQLLDAAGAMVSEQYLIYSAASYSPLYFIYNIQSDNISFETASFFDGYDNLTITRKGEEEPVLQEKLTSKNFNVALEAGRYVVTVAKSEEVFFEFPLRVYSETIEELSEKILSTFSTPSEWQLSTASAMNDYNKILQELYMLHSEKQDYGSFSLLKSYLDIVNARLANTNQHTKVMMTIHENFGQVQFNQELKTIVVERLTGSDWVPCSRINGSSTQLKQGCLYRVTGKDGNAVLAQAFCFIPEERIKLLLWEEETLAADELADKKEEMLAIAAAYGDFSEEELKYVAIEEWKNPASPIIAKPTAYFYEDDLIIEITDSDFATTVPAGLFAVVQETDLVLGGGYRRRQRFTNGVAIFDGKKDFLRSDEVYAVWIEDCQGEIISLMTFTDEVNLSDAYNNKIRKQRLSEIRASLMSYAEQKKSQDRDAVNSLIDYSFSLADIDADNVHDYLITNCIKNPKISNMHNTIQMLREHYSRNRVDAAFFPQVYYDRQTETLTIPPLAERPYILRVTRFDTYNKTLEDTYHVSDLSAIEIDCMDSEYKIIQAIDQNDFSLSGFIFVCSSPKIRALNSWRVKLEAIN